MRDRNVIPKQIRPDEAVYIEVDVENVTPQDIEIAGKALSRDFFPMFLDKVKKDIPELLEPANFFGEAEEYMYQNNIQFSEKIRNQYAQAIYDDFIASLDKLLIFNDQEQAIYISPYILALEYGDFYRPGLQYISKCIIKYFEDAYKDEPNK
jgi:hypothetical protein